MPLAQELGAEVPPGLAASISEADLDRLAAAVAAARERQAAELRAAMGRSLDHVPRLARGPIKKILFG